MRYRSCSEQPEVHRCRQGWRHVCLRTVTKNTSALQGYMYSGYGTPLCDVQPCGRGVEVIAIVVG